MSAPDFAELRWRKSTHSNGAQECVEVADLPGNGIAVRDSKLGPQSPALVVNKSGWTGLLNDVKVGASRPS